jgi:hypothetical protein
MIAAEDVESFVSEAEKKGMYVVNEDSCDALLQEYNEILAKADKLSSLEDDVSEPYKSKYEARTLLDGVVNKLEATRTIAAVEGNKARMNEMDWRVARARVRLGVISWECEEPHNAQTDLDLAMEFYVPAFVKAVAEVAGEEEADETEASKKKLKEVLERLVPPPLTPTPILKEHKVDAMKCLNMLGILWAGRGQVDKSFLYLLSAKRLYDLDMGLLPLSHADAAAADAELESVYTHNLFYLAQAYGQIGETIKSSEFCYETLQRQLVAPGGLSSPRAALDWAKNCASISDFYKSLGHTKRCALALASAEAVLRDHVAPAVAAAVAEAETAAAAAEEDGGLLRGLSEVQADVNVRWADLELLVLKRAFERESQRLLVLESGSDQELDGGGEGEGEVEGDDDLGAAAVASAKALARASKANADADAEAGAGASEHKSSSVFSFEQDTVEFFSSLPVASVAFIRGGEVLSFERARTVFLRGAARIEAAKKHYLLDGFVTDHVDLLQSHSRLYHYLALFEPDHKRKLAMEGRRVDMLQPLLGLLNKAAYEALHKQLSYELGEAYTAQLEIKMTMVRQGQHQQQQQLDERRMKKSDMSKCNSYATGALAMFTNYLSFFAPSSDINARGGSKPFASMALPELLSLDFSAPDESLVTQDELRHFFNAHFSCCRLLSKMLSPPEAAPQQRVQSLVTSLRRYDWLRKTVPALCEKKGVTVDSVFRNEFDICEEMCSLLPAKIDRVFYQGESACL